MGTQSRLQRSLLALVFVALLCAFSLATAVPTSPHKPTVYIIRHGEKPVSRKEKGLNADGFRRAACLRSVFGSDSVYDIGYIMAPYFNEKGEHRRPYETILPLARDLGLDVDTSCKRNQAKCVASRVKKFSGSGDILISWRHSKIDSIARELGVRHPLKYPSDRYDLIWVIPFPYDNITSIQSEGCPGLDVPAELVVQGI